VFEGVKEDWMSNLCKEYALAAEIREAEALELQTLKEAKLRPDWPLWEKAIFEELDVLKVALKGPVLRTGIGPGLDHFVTGF
jgi:hypothetical protein